MSQQQASLLERVRTEPLPHWVALLVAIVVGLAAASVHWLGLVLGGALVGLVTTGLWRALLAGLGFGLVAVLTWLLQLVIAGSVGDVLAMGLFAWLAIGIGIAASVLGSLVRGVV